MQTTMYQQMYEPTDREQPRATLRVDEDGDVVVTFEEPRRGGTIQVVMSAAQFRLFAERVRLTTDALRVAKEEEAQR